MFKHVGKMKHNGAKICVVYRTLPGESDSALVVGTAALNENYHNTLIKEVESAQGQESNELGDHLNNRYVPDGTNMLVQLHVTGKLSKVSTDAVIMTPNALTEIPLDQLNLMIAEQKNVAVDDLAITNTTTTTNKTKVEEIPISDMSPTKENQIDVTVKDHSLTESRSDVIIEDLAKENKTFNSARDYRSEADRLYKEAAKLRKMADDLDPPKKKASSAVSTQEET